MDSNIDLTTDRDFRRRVSPSVPRSIFHHKGKQPRVHLSPYTPTQTMGNNWIVDGTYQQFTSITTSTGMNMSINGSMYNNYEYISDDNCDCCGKDISRIPWDREKYYNLCKKCYIRNDPSRSHRIPWK